MPKAPHVLSCSLPLPLSLSCCHSLAIDYYPLLFASPVPPSGSAILALTLSFSPPLLLSPPPFSKESFFVLYPIPCSLSKVMGNNCTHMLVFGMEGLGYFVI